MFVEGLNLASALAVGHGGVFVGQAPYLLFYPDRDRDDRPDGDPEVLLAGFGLQDAHATVNSMTWGPDGWLYGARGARSPRGSAATSSSKASGAIIPATAGSRSSPRGAAIPGGSTSTRPATPSAAATARTSRFTWSRAAITSRASPSTARCTTRTPTAISARSPTAGPSTAATSRRAGSSTRATRSRRRSAGTFIGGNLLSNAVYWHVLERDGSTFAGRHGGTLIDARDRWFRPIDLLAGPDAAVYVVDWYDKRAAHLDPRDTWDRTNGRIYRVVYGERRKLAPFDLAKRRVRRAGRPAAPAPTTGSPPRPGASWPSGATRRSCPTLKRLLAADRDETVALRDLWALHVSGGLDDRDGAGAARASASRASGGGRSASWATTIG